MSDVLFKLLKREALATALKKWMPSAETATTAPASLTPRPRAGETQWSFHGSMRQLSWCRQAPWECCVAGCVAFPQRCGTCSKPHCASCSSVERKAEVNLNSAVGQNKQLVINWI